jgi:hypothetical protein
MATSTFRRRDPKLAHDPNAPNVPMGGSKNEVLYIALALGILLLIALSFWFQASR